ncbi:hypothetical protein AX17_000330 [Amanita inopinata Kibby_2008]|nr:hypothetical protein AX17_000330 [Amanita inopinata Kibby_2008]
MNIACLRLKISSPSHLSGASTPRVTATMKVESPTSNQAHILDRATSASPVSAANCVSQTGRLSSPFAPRTPAIDKNAEANRSRQPSGSPSTSPVPVDGLSRRVKSISRPPSAPTPRQSVADTMAFAGGGEMRRIRQTMLENQIAFMKEAETRRPEYLKREKRELNAANFNDLMDDSKKYENDKSTSIGITESPSKGRRLKLFQETSDESFEESLMAGGYGRYRTAEWVRQPQPLSLASTGLAGTSNVVALLEQAGTVPTLLPEKEQKKRRRLEAFRIETLNIRKSNLVPIELEGRGRVLMDSTCEGNAINNDVPPTKRRGGGGRRRKKGSDPLGKDKRQAVSPMLKDALQRPNWPDHEFPWRLRTDEMAEMIKAEEESRLKWIERFLSRDSDDDSAEEGHNVNGDLTGADQEIGFSIVYGSPQTEVLKMGRGKRVTLSTKYHGTNVAQAKGKGVYHADPADARIALLAKSARTLSDRQQRRRREALDHEDEVACICGGADNGRELVQCDSCETWYHLRCIGIKSVAELGKEEDPWFCHACEAKSRAPSSEAEDVLSSEPTFVPTDDEPPQRHQTHDAPFFQLSSPHNSPSTSFLRVPKTPTPRGDSESEPGLSSGSSWINSSRHGPSTPQYPLHGVRVYSRDAPGLADTYCYPVDESPFDPASTPSRGIKFGAPFLTPKNQMWSARPPGLLQTPSRPSGHDSANRSGLTLLTSTLDENKHKSGTFGCSPFVRLPTSDGSPIRRRSGEEPKMRRTLDSPLLSRSYTQSQLEESPIMRYRGNEKM